MQGGREGGREGEREKERERDRERERERQRDRESCSMAFRAASGSACLPEQHARSNRRRQQRAHIETLARVQTYVYERESAHALEHRLLPVH